MSTLELWGPACDAEDHFITSSYVAKQMYPEAVARADNAVEYYDRTPRLLAAQAEAYAAAGRITEVEKILQELEAAAEERYVDPVLLALVHVALEDNDAAFDMLERAYEIRSPWLPVMSVDPKVDPLRDDPRFADLMRRIGLEPGQFARPQEAA